MTNTATLPIAAVKAAQSTAGQKAAATRRLAGSDSTAGQRAAATRRARLDRQALEAAQLEAERAERIAAASDPVTRARRSIAHARQLDEDERAEQVATARIARLNRHLAAARAVAALGLKEPGTSGRKRPAWMVTDLSIDEIEAAVRRRTARPKNPRNTVDVPPNIC